MSFPDRSDIDKPQTWSTFKTFILALWDKSALAEGFQIIASAAAVAAASSASTTQALRDSFVAVYGSIGYQVPVSYVAGIQIKVASQTVNYSGQDYAPLLSALPFTTSGTFETAKFRLLDGVKAADLATPPASMSVGHSATQNYVAATIGAVLNDVLIDPCMFPWLAKFDSVTNDSAALQACINFINTRGGGKIQCPGRTANLGTQGITTYQNVRILGDAQAYVNSTRGTQFLYSGTGSGIYGVNLLNNGLEYISLDCTNATGTAVRGIYMQGVWLSTLRNVRVKGVPPSKGYGILLDTNAGGPTWGGQHNLLEMIECADGIIRIAGDSSNSAVTTTVLNTIRGFQYQMAFCQVVAINATAESWTVGAGWDWSGAGTHGTMIGCDIEGAGPVGIQTDGLAEVREVGTIWEGFTGANRVMGPMGSNRVYNAATTNIQYSMPAGAPVEVSNVADKNISGYTSEEVFPVSTFGGSQEGYRRWNRLIAGAKVLTHEFEDHFFVKTTKATSSVSPVTICTVSVKNGLGVKLSVHAYGTQQGDGAFSHARDCVAANIGGSIALTQSTPLAANGSGGVISFVGSGSNVLVQWTPTTVNASNSYFNIEMRGAVGGYAKG